MQVTLGGCTSETAVRVFRVGRPPLDVRRDAERVVLSWSVSGFMLQETDDLNAPVAWSESTIEVSHPIMDGEVWNEAVFDLPGGSPKKFFRLYEVP